jgi:toxin ParE1/3/4
MVWSLREFGERAALRSDTLIRQALKDIAEDPERPGSKERPEMMVAGARTYHLAFSCGRIKGTAVKTPRHFLLYRRSGEIIEVGRILHDSRDLARHLPGAYLIIESGEG